MEKALRLKVAQINKIKLLDLVKNNGGCTGYHLSVGGDERGYFGCELQIHTAKNTTIVVSQRPGTPFTSPEPEFLRFLKRYSAILQLKPKNEQPFQEPKRKVYFQELILT